MKEVGEILAVIRDTIAGVYRRPKMYGANAVELDTVLWHYHFLWFVIMERDIEEFRSAVSTIHSSRHHCNLSIVDHFRKHKKDGAEAAEERAMEYVISKWKELDKKTGIPISET